MIKLINKVTGGEMYVAEERVEEYTTAGYKLVGEPSPDKHAQKKPKAALKKGKAKK